MEICPSLLTTKKSIKPVQSKFLRDLHSVMKNPEFSTFFDEYCSDWTDTQTVLMYMKLYKTLEQQYSKKHGKPIHPELLLYAMKQIFSDSKYRQMVVKSFEKFKNNDKQIECS